MDEVEVAFSDGILFGVVILLMIIVILWLIGLKP
jgi:tetrahydromethanopterin S-methyltransferase subunit G